MHISAGLMVDNSLHVGGGMYPFWCDSGVMAKLIHAPPHPSPYEQSKIMAKFQMGGGDLIVCRMCVRAFGMYE